MTPNEPIPLGVVLLGVALMILVLSGIIGALIDVGAALDKAWKDQQKTREEQQKNGFKQSETNSAKNEIRKPGQPNSRGSRKGTKY